MSTEIKPLNQARQTQTTVSAVYGDLISEKLSVACSLEFLNNSFLFLTYLNQFYLIKDENS